MIGTFLAIFILIHGLIHLIGFIKSFDLAEIPRITGKIPKSFGIAWLLVALLFVLSAIHLFMGTDWWWPIALIGALLSILLLIPNWTDTRIGAIPNAIIVLIAFLETGSVNFEKRFREDAGIYLPRNKPVADDLVTETDLAPLPLPVRNYLQYVDVIYKPKVKNMRVLFSGRMRDKGKDYFNFTSEQYNCFVEPTRLFFMKGELYGLKVPGYHKYTNGHGSMNIKLWGMIPVVSHAGETMDKTETVTMFNDMCLLAPATLIDKRIHWTSINDSTVEATFTNKEITISATLYFNWMGQLTNFVSNDRTSVSDMEQMPFSTPITTYDTIHGYRLMSKGEAVWHTPQGKFSYGEFHLKDIQYNVKQVSQ